MVIAISHDVTTKEGHLSIAAKLNNNLDGKLMLPSGGDPVAMLVASHRYKNGSVDPVRIRLYEFCCQCDGCRGLCQTAA